MKLTIGALRNLIKETTQEALETNSISEAEGSPKGQKGPSTFKLSDKGAVKSVLEAIAGAMTPQGATQIPKVMGEPTVSKTTSQGRIKLPDGSTIIVQLRKG